jgi:hypothetical protein
VNYVQPRRKIIQPFALFCCYCFCSKSWMRTHLSNDWLAGCWFIFWGTLLATLVCLVLTLMALADHNVLQCFIYGTAYVMWACVWRMCVLYVCAATWTAITVHSVEVG